MYAKKKKNPRGLKVFLVITYLVFALFALSLVLFGALASKTNDADLNGGIGAVFKYHFSGVSSLFIFKFNNASNIVYLALSGFLYLFIVLALILGIAGIVISAKRKRAIIVPSLIALLLVILVFMMLATGLPKYWAIINKRGAFAGDNTLIFFTVFALFSGAAFILLAYISYLASLLVTLKTSNAVQPEKKEENTIVDESENQQEEEAFVFEPIPEEAIPEEAMPVPELEPEPEPEHESEQAPKKSESTATDKEDLRALLKEVVRDIVRDEIARNNANQPRNENAPASNITGATFGGPLVVQYFNGGINSAAVPETVKEEKPAPAPQPKVEENKEEKPVSQTESKAEETKEEKPAPAPQPKVEEPAPVVEEQVIEEPAPAPIVEEPVPEPAVEEQVIEKPAPAPVVEESIPEPEEVPDEAQADKKPIIRIPFTERMINADPEMQKNYNELKNEIMSYGVNSRVSNSGDTFRLHRVTYIKITIAGLSLKLYFALNPDDYKDSTLPIQNAGHKGIYADIPLVFKVKSGLSMRRCKQLIADVFEKNGLEQGEIGNVDWVEELKKEPQQEDKDED